MYQSEIRPSQISKLLEKVRKRSYERYLLKVSLDRVRGFQGAVVTFDSPVTALIGPNGGGKTTILGSAACAYKDIKPRQFFAKSGELDSGMRNWVLTYEVIDRGANPKDTIKRTSSFHTERWSRDALPRKVIVFGVARTVPATERVELRKYASNSFTADAARIGQIEKTVAKAVGRILGKDISQYSHIKIDNKGRVSLLAGLTNDKTRYSEFHFGAGESSVIRMVMGIEASEANALILIEEIENGLHPIATIRMVEYLLEVAERKSTQAIFTTHSNDALVPLPSEAIWAAVDGEVFQGKLSIHSLRAITPRIDARLVIFVEDNFAKLWVESLLRAYGGVAVDLVEVHAMEGDGTAVKVNRHHNIDPASKSPSICVIDGDSRQKDDMKEKVYRLPGGAPETFIYDAVLDMFERSGGELTLSLHQAFETTTELGEKLKQIRLTNHDSHVIFSQVGRALGFIPEVTVQSAFISTWARKSPEEVQKLIEPFKELLPMEKDREQHPTTKPT